MIWTFFKAIISAAVIVAVAEVSGRPGTLLQTLLLSFGMLALVILWTKEGEVTAITRLSRETLGLVSLGCLFSFLSPCRIKPTLDAVAGGGTYGHVGTAFGSTCAGGPDDRMAWPVIKQEFFVSLRRGFVRLVSYVPQKVL